MVRNEHSCNIRILYEVYLIIHNFVEILKLLVKIVITVELNFSLLK